jgi:molybdopterin converting factor subunit 1
MTIKVKFFAAIRETVGQDSIELGAAAHGDLMQLLETLRGLLSEEAFDSLRASNVRIAVNREFVEGACVLRDGDEVAFMPPITGG